MSVSDVAKTNGVINIESITKDEYGMAKSLNSWFESRG